MEIYNEDKSFDIIKKELNRNKTLLVDEYTTLKQMKDPAYNGLVKKYEEHFNEQRDNNNKTIEHIKQVIDYLNKDSNEYKLQDVKKLYKIIDTLL